AIKRYKIKHPVVVDDDMAIWERYTVNAWPTFVLIDSRGYMVGQISGEGHRDVLDKAIAQALADGKARGTLASKPFKPVLPSDTTTSTLAFPGKILADAAGKRLFISDSNHNRIIITALPDANGKAKTLAVIGNGNAALKDGPASS